MKCFLGAHGTGKTTLINQVRNLRKDIFVTDAFSRPIKKAAQSINLSDVQIQVLNFELMIWAQRNYYDQNVLTTRSLFDSIIFAKLFTPDLYIKDIEDELYENSYRIKKIFYLPIEFNLQDDGVRYNREVQERFDKEIQEVISRFSVQSRVIPLTGSVEERTETLLNAL